jgi:hypothetical protein
MFIETCCGALFIETAPVHLSMKNSASTFRAANAPELCDPHIPPDAKTQVRHTMSRRAFLSKLHWADPRIKNSASRFHAPDAP